MQHLKFGKKVTRIIYKSIAIYNLYKWKLNHDQTIWDEEWDVIGNVLMNTLGTILKIKIKIPPTPPAPPPAPKPKRKNLSPPNLPIGYFQKGLSPFQTWNNTPIIKGGHL